MTRVTRKLHLSWVWVLFNANGDVIRTNASKPLGILWPSMSISFSVLRWIIGTVVKFLKASLMQAVVYGSRVRSSLTIKKKLFHQETHQRGMPVLWKHTNCAYVTMIPDRKSLFHTPSHPPSTVNPFAILINMWISWAILLWTSIHFKRMQVHLGVRHFIIYFLLMSSRNRDT